MVLEDYNTRVATSEPEDFDKEYFHSYGMLPKEPAARILPDFRHTNLTPEEKKRGIPEAKIVVKRIPHVPEFISKSESPHVSTLLFEHLSHM
jgi:hypothetical protein